MMPGFNNDADPIKEPAWEVAYLGDTAESALLDGFRVDVDEIWRAASSASSLSNH